MKRKEQKPEKPDTSPEPPSSVDPLELSTLEPEPKKPNPTLEEKVEKEVENPDEAIEALKKVMHGIRTGEAITDSEPLIARLVANQEARAKVINSLMLTHDYERLVKFIEARKKLDKVLFDGVNKNELKPSEALGFYKLLTVEVEDIASRMRAQMVGHDDMMNLINKVNWATSMSDADLAEKFKNTSPQGREIIRKLAYKLKKTSDALPSDKLRKGAS